MNAAYVFTVEFRLEPDGVRVSPNRFETTMEIPAPTPPTASESGPESGDGSGGASAGADAAASDWRFFRDRLWRGELGAPERFRSVASDRLGVEVTAVTFRELRTDEAYLDALRESVAANLEDFRAESVDDALHKYLGSSIHVRD
ncbi:hypothetical protein GCM10027435_05240 [Haloparvum alkalitolerans]|uniref:LWR-salt protein n=1 Tax=Haloparvum alkalitolerans TaxID=1042953 RepID=UPI003CF739DC